MQYNHAPPHIRVKKSSVAVMDESMLNLIPHKTYSHRTTAQLFYHFLLLISLNSTPLPTPFSTLNRNIMTTDGN